MEYKTFSELTLKDLTLKNLMIIIRFILLSILFVLIYLVIWHLVYKNRKEHKLKNIGTTRYPVWTLNDK